MDVTLCIIVAETDKAYVCSAVCTYVYVHIMLCLEHHTGMLQSILKIIISYLACVQIIIKT